MGRLPPRFGPKCCSISTHNIIPLRPKWRRSVKGRGCCCLLHWSFCNSWLYWSSIIVRIHTRWWLTTPNLAGMRHRQLANLYTFFVWIGNCGSLKFKRLLIFIVKTFLSCNSWLGCAAITNIIRIKYKRIMMSIIRIKSLIPHPLIFYPRPLTRSFLPQSSPYSIVS